MSSLGNVLPVIPLTSRKFLCSRVMQKGGSRTCTLTIAHVSLLISECKSFFRAHSMHKQVFSSFGQTKEHPYSTDETFFAGFWYVLWEHSSSITETTSCLCYVATISWWRYRLIKDNWASNCLHTVSKVCVSTFNVDINYLLPSVLYYRENFQFPDDFGSAETEAKDKPRRSKKIGQLNCSKNMVLSLATPDCTVRVDSVWKAVVTST